MITFAGGLVILAALAHAAPVAEERFVPVPHSGINDKRFVPVPHSGINERYIPVSVPDYHDDGKNEKRAVSLNIKQHANKHLSRRDEHSETIHNWHNNVFTVDIDIGTPKQTFQVQLDTGSNALWVWSDTCANECPTAQGFVRSKSSSYTTSNANFTSDYVVTTIEGQVGQDTVSIGGYDVKGQSFGVALNASGTGFEDSSVSGILGFAFPSGGEEGAFPATRNWWAHAVEEWPEQVFGIGLVRTPDRKPLAQGGKLTLGGVDTAAFTGDLEYLPVVGDSAWKVEMDTFKINGKALGGRHNATIDSGTTGLMGPLETVAGVYQSIPGSFYDEKASTKGTLEYYRYPCEHGPEVALAFGGVDYELNKDDLWIFQNKHNTSSGEVTCLGNVFGWAHDDWVVGNAFMNSAYVAFRREPRGIAFAPYKE